MALAAPLTQLLRHGLATRVPDNTPTKTTEVVLGDFAASLSFTTHASHQRRPMYRLRHFGELVVNHETRLSDEHVKIAFRLLSDGFARHVRDLGVAGVDGRDLASRACDWIDGIVAALPDDWAHVACVDGVVSQSRQGGAVLGPKLTEPLRFLATVVVDVLYFTDVHVAHDVVSARPLVLAAAVAVGFQDTRSNSNATNTFSTLSTLQRPPSSRDLVTVVENTVAGGGMYRGEADWVRRLGLVFSTLWSDTRVKTQAALRSHVNREYVRVYALGLNPIGDHAAYSYPLFSQDDTAASSRTRAKHFVGAVARARSDAPIETMIVLVLAGEDLRNDPELVAVLERAYALDHTPGELEGHRNVVRHVIDHYAPGIGIGARCAADSNMDTSP